jgi:hypothetical protein
MARAELPREDLPMRLEEFRTTGAPDQYEVETLVPWPDVEQELAALEPGISAFQGWVDGDGEVNELAELIQSHPVVVRLLRLLFVAPSGVGFIDGRELPEDDQPRDAEELAKLALDLGLRRLVPPGAKVIQLSRVAVIANDARRRGYRRRETLQQRVADVVQRAVRDVELRSGTSLDVVPSAEHPEPARGRGLTVLAALDRPIAAIANVFQASSGGHQQRDLEVAYPQLQEALDDIPMSLIVIADGRGVVEAPARVLSKLFESVAACMTLAQAERGDLADALDQALADGGTRVARRGSLQGLIDAWLSGHERITTSDLPVSSETARLALSEYVQGHEELALELAPDGSALRWRDSDLVVEAQRSRQAFAAGSAVDLLSNALRLRDVTQLPEPSPGVLVFEGRAVTDPVLPERLVIGAAHGSWGESELRDVARTARRHVPNSTLAIMLVEDASTWRATVGTRALQRQLSTTVVAVDAEDLVTIAGATSPRDALVQIVLEHADLTKANPFSPMGVTPPEMFYGREVEEADLMATLSAHSAALIGGRRIGKTSLLQRVMRTLRGEDWTPYYADLQEVGDWHTFIEHVGPRWEVALPEQFAPAHVATLVEQLQGRGEGKIIIALDEVDHLLRWDQSHADGLVPEAFFRACRALSQEGTAQFVFSGERTIAERLWDPASPHWNFCQPLPVKQLSRNATDALLRNPLRALGVALYPVDECLELAWGHSHGHPQIVQFLGDLIVRRLNERAPEERSIVQPSMIAELAEDEDFRRHYLTTYWGQSTHFERLLTALLSLGHRTVDALRDALAGYALPADADAVTAALRMLDLYGIVEGVSERLTFRAEWFPEAMTALGGPEVAAADFAGGLQAPTG